MLNRRSGLLPGNSGVREFRSLRVQEFGSPGIINSINSKTPKLYKLKRGQTSIEMSIAVMCFIVLIFGILQVFSWVNSSLVTRQVDYERETVTVSQSYSYQAASEPGRLNIFGEAR